ncbi:KH domain-containing protein [Candidatus Shapirobacteria bacterium]|nr:KH domain-containing protein [Candidatus Shapirobacteria bacterium]
MKELLEFLVKSIVNHPQEVVVEEEREEDWLNLNLAANPEDVKIIIGKKGRTIKALRELLKIKAIKDKVRVNLNLNQ